jgi:hypothetical protein
MNPVSPPEPYKNVSGEITKHQALMDGVEVSSPASVQCGSGATDCKMQRALHYVKYWVKEGGESYALKEPAN